MNYHYGLGSFVRKIERLLVERICGFLRTVGPKQGVSFREEFDFEGI